MSNRASIAAAAAALGLSVLGTAWAGTAGAGAAATALPPVRHVFVIMLENEGYASTFGQAGADPYLARTLVSQGTLLTQYYGVGHQSLDNYVALVSGQAPNADTQADCQTYVDFPASATIDGGQQAGAGCIYPAGISNVGNQLSASGYTWKGYMEDMGNDPSREAAACGHPVVDQADHTQSAESGDGYASRHDPFVYFHSDIDSASYCDSHVVALGGPTGTMPRSAMAGETGLAADLRSPSTTPNLAFITPNLCDDGHDYPCANEPSPGGSAAGDTDAFLHTWVPLITASAAFRQDGLLLITFDEASSSDASACCNEAPGPGSPSPGISGPGGGRVGAVALSPFIRGGTVSSVPYNHYSALATVESLFGLGRLGEAATSSTFGADVFAGPPGPTTSVTEPDTPSVPPGAQSGSGPAVAPGPGGSLPAGSSGGGLPSLAAPDAPIPLGGPTTVPRLGPGPLPLGSSGRGPAVAGGPTRGPTPAGSGIAVGAAVGIAMLSVVTGWGAWTAVRSRRRAA